MIIALIIFGLTLFHFTSRMKQRCSSLIAPPLKIDFLSVLDDLCSFFFITNTLFDDGVSLFYSIHAAPLQVCMEIA